MFVKLTKTFEKTELTFAAKKCFIGYKELSMYGFIVSKREIKVDVNGLRRIQQWSKLKNQSEIWSFHRTIGYY